MLFQQKSNTATILLQYREGRKKNIVQIILRMYRNILSEAFVANNCWGERQEAAVMVHTKIKNWRDQDVRGFKRSYVTKLHCST